MDYRVKVTIRNNRLLKAIEAKGFNSVKSFCDAYQLNYVYVNELIAGKRSPINKITKNVSERAKTILEILETTVDEGFTEKQLEGFKRNSYEIEVKEKDLMELAAPKNQKVEVIAMENDLKSTLNKILRDKLSPREENIIRRHFYQNESIPDIAKSFDLSKERVSQLLKRGMYKIGKCYPRFLESGITDVFPKVGNTSKIKKVSKHYTNPRYTII